MAALETYSETIATETLTKAWLKQADDACFVAEGKADGQHWSIALRVV